MLRSSPRSDLDYRTVEEESIPDGVAGGDFLTQFLLHQLGVGCEIGLLDRRIMLFQQGFLDQLPAGAEITGHGG